MSDKKEKFVFDIADKVQNLVHELDGKYGLDKLQPIVQVEHRIKEILFNNFTEYQKQLQEIEDSKVLTSDKLISILQQQPSGTKILIENFDGNSSEYLKVKNVINHWNRENEGSNESVMMFSIYEEQQQSTMRKEIIKLIKQDDNVERPIENVVYLDSDLEILLHDNGYDYSYTNDNFSINKNNKTENFKCEHMENRFGIDVEEVIIYFK